MFSGSSSHPELFASVPAAHRGRRQPLLLLALALLSLFFVAAGEYARSATPGAGKGGIVAALEGPVIAALQDPLALLARRSPGHRGPGALHLTKSAAGPHERVLAGVRQRDLAPDLAPAPGAPVIIDIAPDAVAAPIAAPGGGADTGPVNGSLMPALVTPVAFPGIAGLPGPAAVNSAGPGAAPGGTTPGGPGSPGGPGTSPGSPGGPPGSPGTPPGSPGGPSAGTPPPTITVREPATWLLMILGLVVLLVMRRFEFGRTA